MQCEKAFKSFGGEGAHMHRCHGHVHPVRTLMSTTHCGACLKEYHTMGRLKAHLLRADPCRTALLGSGLRVEVQPGIGSLDDSARYALWDNRLPPLPAAGPLPLPGRHRDFAIEDVELYEELVLGLLDLPTEGFEAQVRTMIQRRPITWTRCYATITEVIQQLDLEGLPDSEAQQVVCKRSVLEHLRRPSEWQFLCIHRTQPDSALPGLNELPHLVDSFEIKDDYIPVPRPPSRERVFLHAFSGRRRAGDLQHYLEAAFARSSEGVLLHVVSMDVVIDPLWGDARNEEVRDFWLRGARQGFVQGGLCGPPCETWSQARHVQVEDTAKKQPRPLRSCEDPWGISSLSLREMEQTEVGNELLLFSFELMVSLACSAGSGVLEHPGEPKAQDKPSILALSACTDTLAVVGVRRCRLCTGAARCTITEAHSTFDTEPEHAAAENSCA